MLNKQSFHGIEVMDSDRTTPSVFFSVLFHFMPETANQLWTKPQDVLYKFPSIFWASRRITQWTGEKSNKDKINGLQKWLHSRGTSKTSRQSPNSFHSLSSSQLLGWARTHLLCTTERKMWWQFESPTIQKGKKKTKRHSLYPDTRTQHTQPG